MKILVVEDEPIIRLGIVAMVEEAGFSAVEASNADQAIQVIERTADIAVVITDVDMPGTMDGVRLAHFVHSRWPPIRLIVVSGKIGIDEAALPAGARFFSKPLPEDRLLATVRDMIGQSSP
jgi:two-component system, response regulator PdtaR